MKVKHTIHKKPSVPLFFTPPDIPLFFTPPPVGVPIRKLKAKWTTELTDTILHYHDSDCEDFHILHQSIIDEINLEFLTSLGIPSKYLKK